MSLSPMLQDDPPARRPVGRPPTPYDPVIAEEICVRIATGNKGLVEICRTDPNLVSYHIVMGWLRSNVEFVQMLARAKELQADYLADELLTISDEAEGDAEIRYTVAGVPYAAMNGRFIQRAKLMTETRLKLMAMLNRARYGDNVDITSAGKALAAPVTNIVQLDAKVQSIMLLAAARRAGLKMID